MSPLRDGPYEYPSTVTIHPKTRVARTPMMRVKGKGPGNQANKIILGFCKGRDRRVAAGKHNCYSMSGLRQLVSVPEIPGVRKAWCRTILENGQSSFAEIAASCQLLAAQVQSHFAAGMHEGYNVTASILVEWVPE